MAKKVTYAKLHGEVFAPGLGNLGSVLPPQSKRIPGFEMEYDADGLKVTSKGVKFLVPPSSVLLVVFAPEASG